MNCGSVHFPYNLRETILGAVDEDLIDERRPKLIETTRELAGKLKIENSDKLTVIRNDFTPLDALFAAAVFPDGSEPFISLSYFHFLEPEDFPKHLILEEGDARFDSAEYLQEVILWLKDFLKLQLHDERGDLRKQLYLSEVIGIKLFLKLIRKPILFREAKLFVIAHELGHLQLKLKGADAKENGCKSASVAICSSALTYGMTSPLMPFACSIGISLMAAAVTYKIAAKLFSHHAQKKEEKSADKIAKRIVSSKGFIEYCKLKRQEILTSGQHLIKFQDKIIHFLKFDSLGNFRFEFLQNHPNFSTRENYLA
jgi:hypothetical protein